MITQRRIVDEFSERALIAAAVSPTLARLYAARNIRSAQELEHALARLPSPALLKGMEAAVERLSRAIDANERICIVADYDADGATACSIGLRGLRAMGASVDYLVPNRFEFGYGLTPEIVALAIEERAPQLMVTVDNGIASIDGVAAARAAGIEVIVTDHHLPAATLPDAIIVNPNQPGCTFPSKALAGVGVMFYVLMALRAHRQAAHVNLAQWLDIVAVGTVADVVPLDAVNRIFVEQGVRRMRAGHACPGVRALFTVAGRDIARANAADLGFVVGPRINAAGRLSDISLGIACLTSDTDARASEIAAELDALNRERREIEVGMVDEAVREASAQVDEARKSVCVFNETWHQGVVGIVAGRIKDALHRPTIVFAPTGDDGMLRGSGRSIAGFHLRDALDLVSKRHPTLIEKFGGHAMAAGLSLRQSQWPQFASAFDDVAGEWLSPAQLQRIHMTDGEFPATHMSVVDVDAMMSAVWGQGFPAPSFDEIVQVLDVRIVGVKHNKLRVRRACGETLTALVWNETNVPNKTALHIVFRPVVNEFQGSRSVELMIDAWERA